MGEAEAGTLRIAGVNPNLTTYFFHDELADREAQAATANLFVHLFKAGEDLRLLLQGDAATRIGYAELRGVFIAKGQAEGDRALAGELRGVDEQVDEELLQASGVGSQLQLIQIAVKADFSCCLFDAVHGLNDLATDSDGICLLIGEVDMPLLQCGEIDHVVNQLDEQL